jgi:hypothetical protein
MSTGSRLEGAQEAIGVRALRAVAERMDAV